MPQAPDGLRAKFPGGCEEAIAVLSPSCVFETNGTIRPRFRTTIGQFTDRDWDAVDYLIQEWDYSWDNWSAEHT